MADLKVYFFDGREPVVADENNRVYDIGASCLSDAKVVLNGSRWGKTILPGDSVVVAPGDQAYFVRDVKTMPQEMLRLIRLAYLKADKECEAGKRSARDSAAAAVRNLLDVRRIITEQINKIRASVGSKTDEAGLSSLESLLRAITG